MELFSGNVSGLVIPSTELEGIFMPTSAARRERQRENRRKGCHEQRGSWPCRPTQVIPNPTGDFRPDFGSGFPVSWRIMYIMKTHNS